ncbi:MAG: ABC transporter permease subunit [Geminicoccaceae bacterium]
MAQATELALPGRAAKARRKESRGIGLPFALTLPTLIVVFLVIGIPLAYSLVLSLYRINMLTKRWSFVGLRNYLDVLPHPDFIAAMGRTAYFTAITVSGGLVLGIAMALVLNANFRGRNFLRSAMLIPWAMAPVAVGILWSWIFDGSYGTLNALLFDLGLITEPIAWLASGWTAFNLVALVHVWNQAPLTALLVLAALQSMPENLHRAARIDGAGPVERFFRITLPWLRPMLLLIMLLTSINSIMAFDLFWIMTKGGPGSATTVFSWMGYSYAFQLSKFGEGAAVLYILTIVCLLLAWVYLKLFTATDRRPLPPLANSDAAAIAVPHHDSRTATRLIKLPAFTSRAWLSGRTRRVAARVGLAAAAIFILVWSVGPFLWLLLMSLSPSVDLVRTPPTLIPNSLTLENYRFVLFPSGVSDGQGSQQAARVPIAIWNSLVVAVSVTIINLVLGSLAGYAYARHSKSRVMNGTLWALMMTRMTPSLALILPFFIVFRNLGLLDTHTGLVIAYCSLILPLSTWMMKGYFENLPPNLEKAALVDGCTPFQAIWKIILPVARPGIVAAGIFCFLVSWNEFVFALILSSTVKAQTIPVIIAGFLVQLRFYDYGPMFAASVLAVVPPVVIALAFQRYLVRGMLSGSIKG